MAYILFEDPARTDLFPFTFTRPVADLRAGIFTQEERWTAMLGVPVHVLAPGYLHARYSHLPETHEATWINARMIPDAEGITLVQDLRPDTFYTSPAGELLAARFALERMPTDGILSADLLSGWGLRQEVVHLQPLFFRQVTDFFSLNAALIARDFPLAVQAAPNQPIRDPHTRVYGADNLYLAPGATLRAAIINAEDGPVYIGPHADIGEGAILKRSHAICAHAAVSMGAKLRGDTTIGPYAKAGGEIGNSVIMGYSNKAHDGYLGNSVLGYWCNLGADTNTSNLKNTYAPVKLWHYGSGRFRDTGLQFCGLIMGDHSKSGINTMFNTGTVTGVSANVFGAGYSRPFIPSFAWGGVQNMSTYRLSDALDTARIVMSRRQVALTEADAAIMQAVFELSAAERTWDKG
jgi:UDP-N-acetylglucosamine diphosphorylase/glucosamine-1-phosphate N-acetyltransferase